MYEKWIESLKSSSLFKGIDSDSLNIMLECFQPRIQSYSTRDIITCYGDPFNAIGFVAGGKVALTKETYSGNSIMMGIINAGDFFGEMIAFSDIHVWPVTVTAQEDSNILFLPPDKIIGNCSKLCPSHRTLMINMLSILSNKALMMNKKIEYLSAKNIRGKVSSYLLEMFRQNEKTSFIIPMKRHELADYLNIPRPSLSREMSFMRSEGLIDYKGSSVKISNIAMLEKSIE